MNLNHFYPEMHTGLTKRPALQAWKVKPEPEKQGFQALPRGSANVSA